MEDYTVLSLWGVSGTEWAGEEVQGHGLLSGTYIPAPWDTLTTASTPTFCPP